MPFHDLLNHADSRGSPVRTDVGVPGVIDAYASHPAHGAGTSWVLRFLLE
ncbi:hypothetical protein N9B60_06705 [Mariniblastus sp.]|nr:hypothetical protein [Mariniblastus sp.]MDA7925075.1 hypothetical protein [Mariniblastus sp.]